MFVVEKCVKNNVMAQYTAKETHLWVPAWSNGKALVEACSLKDAIAQFHSLTAKVRHAPYRMRTVRATMTIAAKNTLDEVAFQKYSIYAIGFHSCDESPREPVAESLGFLAPGTMGKVVGHSDTKHVEVQRIVDLAANHLAGMVSSHQVTTRFNSDGHSGGAWLVTSPTNDLLSNTDVGITYSHHTNTIKLYVSYHYLADDAIGNKKCVWTGDIGHESEHSSVEAAIDMLLHVCKKATPEQAALLAA